MSILRGTKKLLFAAGFVAGCGATATVIYSGLHKETTESFKAHAFAAPSEASFKSSNFCSSPSSYKWDTNWDRREPSSLVLPLKGDLPESEQEAFKEKLQKAKATATRHIILVRHGQYDTKGATEEDRKLTKLGHEQAHRVGERLKELELPYTRMIKSTQTRATETGDIIHQYLPDVPISSCDFIREGAPIEPDPPSNTWNPLPKKVFEDGARIESAFRKYFHRAEPEQKENSYDVLVCHGNVIRYFVCRALQIPPERWLYFYLDYCSLTWLAIYPSGRVCVYTVGDKGFLKRSLIDL